MRNPLFFFIIVIAIDLILKSAKDKKKIEEARRKRTGDIKQMPTKGKSIMETIREEIEKEVQKGNTKKVVKPNVNKEKPRIIINTDEEIHKRSEWNDDIFLKPVVKASPIKETAQNSLKKDILRGIIFSEIISEPKSLKNQRKSM